MSVALKKNLIVPENVVTFNRNESTLNKVAEEKLAIGDIRGAISIYLQIESSGKYSHFLLRKIADLYAELGLYYKAIDYWFRYLDVSAKKYHVEAYNGLGGCFYLAELYSHALYYYNLQINDKNDAELPYDEYMYELFSEDENNIEDHKFKIVEKLDDNDLEKIELAKSLFHDDRDKSFEILKSIDKKSSKYVDAQGLIAMQYLFQDDYERAIDAYEQVLNCKIDSDFALNNLFSLNFLLNRYDQVEKYRKLIEKYNCADYFHLVKYFHLFYAKNQHERNYLYVREIDKLFPNLTLHLIALGCSAYNIGKYDEAHRYFLDYYKICPSYLTEWYCKLTSDVKNGKKTVLSVIDFNFNLPEYEVKRLALQAERYLESSTTTLKRKSQEVIKFAEAVFCTSRVDLQAMACQVLTCLNNKASNKFLKSLLLRTDVKDNIKSMIVTMLAELGNDKLTGMVFGNVYVKIPFEKTEFNQGNGDIFRFAYSIAFGKLAPVFEDLVYKLKIQAYEIYDELIKNGNLHKVSDPVALGALIAIKSDIKINDNINSLIEYFGTTENSINKIISLLNAEL